MRIILLLSTFLLTVSAFSQAVFEVKSPADIKGFYDFGLADSTQHYWGNGDMSKKSVLAELKLATGADSLAGTTLVGDYTGKIAVVYRGQFPFALKALNAQNAGAVGCIIINNDATNPDAVFIMSGIASSTETAATASGLKVNIPLIMLSKNNGAKISAKLRAGETVMGYLGGKQKLANDLSLDSKYIVTPAARTRNTALVKQGDVHDTLGFAIINRGTTDQVHMLFTNEIEFNGELIHRDTMYFDTVYVGDTLGYITFSNPFKPEYDLEAGEYKLTYKVLNFDDKTFEILSTDEYPLDNVFTTYFHVSDSAFAIGEIFNHTRNYTNPTSSKTHRNVPLWSTFYRPSSATAYNEFSSCIVFSDPNASKVKADGMVFVPYINDAANATAVLKDELFNINVYSWDDAFVNTRDDAFAFDNLNPIISYQEHIAQENLNYEYQYVKFANPIYFANDKRYLACVSTYNPNINFGYDAESASLAGAVAINLQPVMALFVDDAKYAAGFGYQNIPAISLQLTSKVANVEENAMVAGLSVYPNPATNNVNVNIDLKNNSNVKLEIVDLTGKTVSSTTYSNVAAGSHSYDVNTTAISNGIYVINVITNGERISEKLVIRK